VLFGKRELAETKLSQDKYAGVETISSPDLIATAATREDFTRDSYSLCVEGAKSGGRNYRILFFHGGNDWMFLDTAQDSNAHNLPVKVADRHVLAARAVMEVLLIDLTRSYLDQAAAGSGVDIRVSGKRGSAYVKFPAYFVRGFLSKVDQLANQPASGQSRQARLGD
jgi:hypothetical protein